MASPARQARFSVPGCFAKQPGKDGSPFSFRFFFIYFYILTIYLGSLAACAAARGTVMVCRARRAWFSVPGCFGKQPRGVYGVPRSAGTVFFFLSVFHVHRELFIEVNKLVSIKRVDQYVR